MTVTGFLSAAGSILPPREARMRASWLGLVAIGLISCSGTGPSSIDLNLSINTKTRGLHQPDGYTVFIDGTGHPILANGWLHHGIDGWSHTVLLGDVPSNCRVSSPNPTKTGTTSGGVYWSEKIIEFWVGCDWNAHFRATVRTTGGNYDAAQQWSLYASWGDYGLYWPPTDVPVNGSRDFGPILAGEQTVQLSVSQNCQVSGENPRSVMLVHEEVVESVFEVACS